jgi:hypothetical protein
VAFLEVNSFYAPCFVSLQLLVAVSTSSKGLSVVKLIITNFVLNRMYEYIKIDGDEVKYSERRYCVDPYNFLRPLGISIPFCKYWHTAWMYASFLLLRCCHGDAFRFEEWR